MEPLAIPYQDNATVLLVIVEIRVRRLAKRVPMETDASRFVYAKMVQSAIQLMALVTALEIGQENTAMKRVRIIACSGQCMHPSHLGGYPCVIYATVAVEACSSQWEFLSGGKCTPCYCNPDNAVRYSSTPNYRTCPVLHGHLNH
jgi:hypothetical protein